MLSTQSCTHRSASLSAPEPKSILTFKNIPIFPCAQDLTPKPQRNHFGPYYPGMGPTQGQSGKSQNTGTSSKV